ncbi:alpha/beta hydrolase fold domain-containing protein [Streptomyces xiangluensis]|uniref:Alpha/beta hydrolase fold domain-containing protein n=1 Tax=Streptomyces xiangluensis TaxID=2665720 RepID=A0ABV8Z5U0_9ACTN
MGPIAPENTMTYRFDPELAPWAAMLPDLDMTDPAAARETLTQVAAQLPPYESAAPLTVEDTSVPGPPGAPDVPVRVYAPAERQEPLPGLLGLHSGGFMAGGLDTLDAACREIADQVGAVVVSVDYRLAPEHPFPAGVEDAYAALVWLAKEAGRLGVDPGRLGVFGESAGGGLAAATALLARDRSGPELCYQVLDSPELDDRLDTPSMRSFTDTPVWTRPKAVLSWKYYLGEAAGGPDVSAYAAPARAEDLSGLPPAWVAVSEFDPLRDEGITYAQRLVQAGVPTELHLYPGTFHGAFVVPGAAVSERMGTDRIAALRRGLGCA